MSESLSLAFHAMVYIAREPDKFFHVKDIAKGIHGSVHHLARVVIQLSRAGLIETRRGPKGGIKLKKPPEKITLIDVHESIEGKVIKRACIIGRTTCRNKTCIFGDLYNSVRQDVKHYLSKTDLASLAKECDFDDKNEEL
ncbi:MAG: RrF2 family transcriptional regulator [Candidatus Zixiibacteriota bacterium]